MVPIPCVHGRRLLIQVGSGAGAVQSRAEPMGIERASLANGGDMMSSPRSKGLRPWSRTTRLTPAQLRRASNSMLGIETEPAWRATGTNPNPLAIGKPTHFCLSASPERSSDHRRLDLVAHGADRVPWFIKPLLHLRATGLRHMHLTASRMGATRASHSAHAVGDLWNSGRRKECANLGWGRKAPPYAFCL